MFQLAQIYVNRCRASHGTPRYHLLRQIADAVIKDLAEEEQDILNLELNEPADQIPFAEKIDRYVEASFFENRPVTANETIPSHMIATINQMLKENMLNIFDMLKQLDGHYKRLHAFDRAEEISLHSIIELYEYIEWLSYDYAYLHKNTHSMAVDLHPNNKYSFILQLTEVLFALITEHPQSYAFRSLIGFELKNSHVTKDVLVQLVYLLLQAPTRQMSIENLNPAIQKLSTLYNESPDLFNLCFQKIEQSRNDYMNDLSYLFDYVNAKLTNHSNGIVYSLFNLKIFHLPLYQPTMKAALDSSLLNDPVSFFYHFVYIEDHTDLGDNFREFAAQLFDAYHELNPDVVANCLFSKITTDISPCLPYEIYHQMSDLEVFYSWGIDKCTNPQQTDALVHYCYTALNKIKTEDTDMDDSFIKKIMAEYEQRFGSNYSLMRLSSSGSAESLNESFSSKRLPSINNLTK